MREAISLATLAGQGRDVALLHNNLGINSVGLRGPRRGTRRIAAGIAYATARRAHRALQHDELQALSALFDAGRLDEALETAGTLVEHPDAEADTLAEVRRCAARIHTLRGTPGPGS